MAALPCVQLRFRKTKDLLITSTKTAGGLRVEAEMQTSKSQEVSPGSEGPGTDPCGFHADSPNERPDGREGRVSPPLGGSTSTPPPPRMRGDVGLYSGCY